MNKFVFANKYYLCTATKDTTNREDTEAHRAATINKGGMEDPREDMEGNKGDMENNKGDMEDPLPIKTIITTETREEEATGTDNPRRKTMGVVARLVARCAEQ